MKRLVPLINRLDRQEICLLKSLIRGKDSSGDSKRLKLVDAIRTGKAGSDADAQRILYRKAGAPSAYANLKKRLLQDVESVLQITNAAKWSPDCTASLRSRCLSLANSAVGYERKGMNEMALERVAEAVKIASQLDWQSQLVVLNEQASRLRGNRHEATACKLIDDLQLVSSLKQLCERLEGRLVNISDRESLLDEAIKALDEAREVYVQSGRPKLGFWYYGLAWRVNGVTADFDSAKSYAMHQLHLTESAGPSFEAEDKAHAFRAVATVYAWRGDLEHAEDYLEQGRKVAKGHLGAQRAIERTALLMAVQANAWESVATPMAWFKSLKREQQIHCDQFHYLVGISLLQQKPKEALKALRKISFQGINETYPQMVAKLFEIAAYVQAGQLDLADHRLRACRQFMTRRQPLRHPMVEMALRALGKAIRQGKMSGIVPLEEAVKVAPFDEFPTLVFRKLLAGVKMPASATSLHPNEALGMV